MGTKSRVVSGSFDKKSLVRQVFLLIGASLFFCWPSAWAGMEAEDVSWPPLTANTFSANAVSGKITHTCALTYAGGIKCWGKNNTGQLGDNSQIDRLTPVDVVGLSSGVMAVSPGRYHTCALTDAGAVKCWGNAARGQLGNDSQLDRWTPVDVVGLSSEVRAISAGEFHTCALTNAGGVKCWGYNDYGQLGDGTPVDTRLTPVDVSGLSQGVRAISSGISHSCALTNAGGVKCWGDNLGGQLGDGTSGNKYPTPVDVVGLSNGVKAISAASLHTCALTDAGGVKCWGAIGDGALDPKLSPVDVTGLSGKIMAINAGGGHTCALTETGAVKCWRSNWGGQLGDGTTHDRLIPVDVSGLPGRMASISLGLGYTCALSITGIIYCWGDNTEGPTGNGIPAYFNTPQNLVGLTAPAETIAAGDEHACVKNTAGGIQCWGRNWAGQLGDETNFNRFNPVTVKGLGGGMSTVALGRDHSCATTVVSDNKIFTKCWGKNKNGQLGDGTVTSRNFPVAINPVFLVTLPLVDGGDSHTCAAGSQFGSVLYCWGSNQYGQLGNGTQTSSATPALINLPGPNPISSVAAGLNHSCAVKNTALWCWGGNDFGQLGDGTPISESLSPVMVFGLGAGVQTVSAGSRHTCALTTVGGVSCWGDNSSGQLGNNSAVNSSVPVQVAGLGSGVKAITAGGQFSCALTDAGGVKCWGDNSHGQLGNGSLSGQWIPVDAFGLTTGVKAIAAGDSFACAVVNDGSVQCWGSNYYGQLGNGLSGYSTQPVKVVGSVEGWRIHLPLILRP